MDLHNWLLILLFPNAYVKFWVVCGWLQEIWVVLDGFGLFAVLLVITTQNKCMHFCLQLDKLKHISYEEFERLNWLPVTYRFKERVNGIVLRYFNEQCPNY